MISDNTLKTFILVINAWSFIWLNPCEWVKDKQRFRPALHWIQIKSLGIQVEFWKCVAECLLISESIVVLTCLAHVMTFGSSIEEVMLFTFVLSVVFVAFSIQVLLLTCADQTLELVNGLILFDKKLGKIKFFPNIFCFKSFFYLFFI